MVDYKKNLGYLFLIDLDGVLVDNVAFENNVLLEISKELSLREKITVAKAEQILFNQIKKPVEGRNRFRYDFQCQQLGLEDRVWKNAHENCKNNLTLFRDTIKLLEIINGLKQKRTIIVSDSGHWTLEFKLKHTMLKDRVSKYYSQDDFQAYKGEIKYWRELFLKENIASQSYQKIFYLENRIDRIQTLKNYRPDIIGILVMQSEHLEQYSIKQKRGIVDYEVDTLSEVIETIAEIIPEMTF